MNCCHPSSLDPICACGHPLGQHSILHPHNCVPTSTFFCGCQSFLGIEYPLEALYAIEVSLRPQLKEIHV